MRRCRGCWGFVECNALVVAAVAVMQTALRVKDEPFQSLS